MLIKQWEEFIAGSDSHGDQMDLDARKVFLKVVEDLKPKHRWHLGDIWDFRPFRKKADTEEKRESIRKDWDAGLSFLKEYAPTQITLGNHDARLWLLAEERSGVLSDYAQDKVREIEAFWKLSKTEVKPPRS